MSGRDGGLMVVFRKEMLEVRLHAFTATMDQSASRQVGKKRWHSIDSSERFPNTAPKYRACRLWGKRRPQAAAIPLTLSPSPWSSSDLPVGHASFAQRPPSSARAPRASGTGSPRVTPATAPRR